MSIRPSNKHPQPPRRSNSRDTPHSHPHPPTLLDREEPPRSYKDFISYSSEVQNSSNSDLPVQGAKRSSKITSLQQEFQDLKRKIKEVENKNERIIEKINFSKDTQKRRSQHEHPQSVSAYLPQEIGNGEISPSLTRSKWPPVPLPQRPRQLVSSFYDIEPELRSTGNLKARDEEVRIQSRKANESMEGTLSEDNREKTKSRLDIQALEDKYRKEQSKLQYVRNNFKNYSDCVKLIIENQLDQMMSSIMGTLNTIDTKTNKNRDRLSRLEGKLSMPASRGGRRGRSVKLSNSFDVGNKKRDRSQLVIPEPTKNKTKEFESLMSKYEHLLRSKSEELEKVTQQLRLKERELLQAADKMDELKDEKRKMGHEHDEMIAKLQGKIQALTDSRPSEKTSKRELINLSTSRDKFKEEAGDREKSDKYLKQIRVLESKLSFAESRLEEKTRSVEQLQSEMKNINENKTSLINEYQDTFERTRHSHKLKYEELLQTIDTLKHSLKTKETELIRLGEQSKEAESRNMELQLEISNLQQKMHLKEEMDRMEKSAVKRAAQLEEDMPMQNHSMENNQLLVEILEKEKRELQFLYDKIRSEFEVYKLSVKGALNTQEDLRDKDQLIEDLRLQLQRSESSEANPLQKSTSLQRKETNLLETSMLSVGAEEVKTKLNEQEREIETMRSLNEDLKKENIALSSKLIGLGHDVVLNEQLSKQSQDKTKELREYSEQLQKMVSELQRIIQDKSKQLETQKASHQKHLATIENDLRVMEDEFASINSELMRETDKVNIKVMEVQRLQEEIQDWKLRGIRVNEDNKNLELRLADVQEELRKQSLTDTKINDDYKGDISKLKENMEVLSLQNTQLAEANKHQKAKIEELELEVFMDTQNHEDSISSQSEAKAESMLSKLKSLEQINLEGDINKANLERYLKNSEENNTKLMQEVSDLLAQQETKKSEYNNAILGYDEKIQELEQNLESAERALKDREESHLNANVATLPNDRVYKSEVRSQSSLMFSNTSQLYADKEIDFKLSDDGGSDIGDTNVETIFNNVNYPYEKIKLRRKDQVEFISKTAQYINKLKSTINDKNRRIKALEKRITPDKVDFPIRHKESLQQDDFNDLGVDDLGMEDFNENYSVRFDDRKQDRHRKMRQLQNQGHLIMEENNLLLQQVSNLQDELQRAQEQENNLVRMKQILKEQINKLRKTLDTKEAQYSGEISRLQKALQQNVIIHNWEMMRTLIPKILAIACNQELMRKEEKRRELEEYIKIVVNILRVEAVAIRYSNRR